MMRPRMRGLALVLFALLVLPRDSVAGAPTVPPVLPVLPVLPVPPALPIDDAWVEIRSPHFLVVSNADEGKARRTAGDFERIRAVFLNALDDARDESEPVVILAVKDQDGLKELLPGYWAREGARPDGVFQPGFDKHFVLVRLDGRAPARYQLIYHEYFHLLNNRRLKQTPPWLNEGLAEFWGRTSIHGNEAEMGLPFNSRLFRTKSMVPLEELFGLQGNPHAAYPDKVSIFYAQSWALVHYIMLGDPTGRAKMALDQYLSLVRGNVDSVTAARRAFGDLEELQETLSDYVRSDRLRRTRPMEITAPIEIDEASYPARELPRADSLAMRASFLAAGDHGQAAWPLLEEALQLDPVNALAHETKGFLHFFQQKPEEALRWFTRAVELDSQSYISHYYFAVLATENVGNADAWSKAERSLQRAIAINPTFGPGYGQLAYEYLRRDQNLEGALDIARRAVTLEPHNVTYLFNLGHILLRLSLYEEALAIGERFSAIATTPEEHALAAAYRDNIDSYRPSGPRLASTVHYDAKGADIQPWIQGFTEAARRHWSVPPSEAFSVGHVAMEISIRRSGEIVGLRIHDSSGIPALERAAEEALRQALSSNLPPLPDDYPGEILELVVVFWYNETPFDRT